MSTDLKQQNADLLLALRQVMDLQCPVTGNPSHEELMEHWEYEKSQGNGAADANMFALKVMAASPTAVMAGGLSPAQPDDVSDERKSFDEYWNKLDSAGATDAELEMCEFAAWQAWQARPRHCLALPLDAYPAGTTVVNNYTINNVAPDRQPAMGAAALVPLVATEAMEIAGGRDKPFCSTCGYDNGGGDPAATFAAMVAARPTASGAAGQVAQDSGRDAALMYTCIGKGGEYELIGTAKGAGTVSKLDDMRVYRAGNRLYFRTADDFDARMKRIDRQPANGAAGQKGGSDAS